MKRILLTWELGSGLGHVIPLSDLGQHLAEALGVDVWYCFQSLHPQLPPKLFRRMLQAPGLQPASKPITRPCTFSDMLHNVGFDHESHLHGGIRAWRDIFSLVKPDLLIGEFSPMALLAARGLSMARVQVGTGWHVPPPGHPIPAYRHLPCHDPEQQAAMEIDILKRVNHVLAGFNAPPMANLGEFFQEVDLTALSTTPEFDHFDRPEPPLYLGHSPARPRHLESPTWPPGDGARIFAYLKPFAGLTNLLRQLANGRHRVIIHAAEQAWDSARHFSGPNVVVSRQPVAIDSLADADLIISHAGHGLIHETLALGLPMLLLPLHREQQVNAGNARQVGAALSIDCTGPAADGTNFETAIKQLLEQPRFRQTAQACSRRLHPANCPGLKALSEPIAELLQ